MAVLFSLHTCYRFPISSIDMQNFPSTNGHFDFSTIRALPFHLWRRLRLLVREDLPQHSLSLHWDDSFCLRGSRSATPMEASFVPGSVTLERMEIGSSDSTWEGIDGVWTRTDSTKVTTSSSWSTWDEECSTRSVMTWTVLYMWVQLFRFRLLLSKRPLPTV